MNSNELAVALARATDLVLQFARGSLSADTFVSKYGNFYYYEAFDGHEESLAGVPAEFQLAIELHRRVQEEVVNRLALSPYSPEQLREAGRIDVPQARDTALLICAELGARAMNALLAPPTT